MRSCSLHHRVAESGSGYILPVQYAQSYLIFGYFYKSLIINQQHKYLRVYYKQNMRVFMS